MLKREVRQTALMVAATGITNALAYGYSVLMGRMLTPADYGVVVALQAIITIIRVPSSATRTLLVQSVSLPSQETSERDKVKVFSKDLCSILLLTITFLAGLLSLSKTLSRGLRIESDIPVIVAIITILPTSLHDAIVGIFQGLQRFPQLAVLQVSTQGLQLLLGGVLVALGFGVLGAVAALPLAFIFMSVFVLMIFRVSISRALGLLPRREVSQTVLRWLSYVIAFGAIAMIPQMDMIMVKHYFPPEVAGQYAAAFTLGKIVFFLPVGITAVMFPKVSHRATEGRDSRRLLGFSLLGIALPCGLLSAIYFRYPQFVMRLVLGASYQVSGRLLGTMGLAMTLRALLNVWFYYCVALRRERFVWLLVVGALFQFILLVWFHSTLIQVVSLICIVSLILNIGSIIFLNMHGGGLECV